MVSSAPEDNAMLSLSFHSILQRQRGDRIEVHVLLSAYAAWYHGWGTVARTYNEKPFFLAFQAHPHLTCMCEQT